MLKYMIYIEAILSLISFTAMRFDKRMAVKKHRRVPESVLLSLDLLGPVGALLAMDLKWKLGRHKNRKWYFHAVLIIGFILHIWLWYVLLK